MIQKTLTVESEWREWKTIREVYDESGKKVQPVKEHTRISGHGWRRDAVFEFRTGCKYTVVKKEWYGSAKLQDAVYEYTVRERRDNNGNLLGYYLSIVQVK